MDRSIEASSERYNARIEELLKGDVFLMGLSELLQLIGHLKWEVSRLKDQVRELGG